MNVPFLQNATFTGLVSTDDYFTSKEWSEAYNIATFYAQNSAILIEETTYSELTALKANNQLKTGQYYKITDFELKWRGQGLSDPDPIKSSGVIEPLLVTALSSNKISSQAYSMLHPEDILYYDVDATRSYTWGDFPGPGGPIPGIKGWITRRINVAQNIDIGWDWRYIRNNCCKFDISGISLYNSLSTYSVFNLVRTNTDKLYFSLINNNTNNSLNSTIAWSPVTNYVEGDMYFPTNEAGMGGLFNFAPILSTRAQLPTFTTSFTTSGAAANITTTNIRNIKIASGFNNIIDPTNFTNNNFGYNCSYNLIDSSFANNNTQNTFTQNIIGSFITSNEFANSFNKNTISWLAGTQPVSMRFCNFENFFANNLICGSDFEYNIFKSGASDNKFSRGVYNNSFGQNFSRNNILRFTFNNVISDSCTDNNLGILFTSNKIENDFNNNNIGSSFFNNSIKNDFSNNNIGNDFSANVIDNDFIQNTIGNSFNNNTIKNDFSNNTIGMFFQNNVIGNYFQTNTIGSFFENSTVFNNFALNTTQNFFNSALIKNNIVGLDFTGATHVYNTYDKVLFLNSNNEKRLSYNNENDQLVITDPTL